MTKVAAPIKTSTLNRRQSKGYPLPSLFIEGRFSRNNEHNLDYRCRRGNQRKADLLVGKRPPGIRVLPGQGNTKRQEPRGFAYPRVEQVAFWAPPLRAASSSPAHPPPLRCAALDSASCSVRRSSPARLVVRTKVLRASIHA